MNNKEKSDLSIVVNILIIVASSGFVLYLVGYLYFLAYYGTLGIRGQLLEFSYYDYLIIGLIRSVNVLSILVVVVMVYFELKSFTELRNQLLLENDTDIGYIEKDLKEIENQTKTENLEENKEGIKDGLNNIRSGVEIVKKRSTLILSIDKKTSFLMNPFKNQKIKYIIIGLSVLQLFIVFVIYGTRKLDFIVSFLFHLLFLFSLYWEMTILSKDGTEISKRLTQRLPVYFIYSLLFCVIVPISTGYVEARMRLKDNDFPTYQITQQDGSSYKANYILYSKNIFFLFLDQKLTLIPEKEIKSLQKLGK